MICLIAGNKEEAYRWAKGMLLDDDEFFYPERDTDLLFKKDFHVLVIGTAGQNVHPVHFEKILALAKERGRMK